MKRAFELFFYVSVAAGMAMGTSSFLMLAGGLELLRAPWLVVAILVAASFCALVSTAIAKMARKFPTAPGVRTYLKAAFGDRVSLVFVHLYLVFVVLVAGAESYMFALVVKSVIPSVHPAIVIVALIGSVTVANCFGVSTSRKTQMWSTFALAAVVLGLGAAGFGHFETRPIDIAPSGELASLPAVIGMCVFLFIGFEWVTTLGFRPDSYARLVPLGMPLGIALNAVLYSCIVVGIACVLPREIAAASPIPHVPYASALSPRYGALVALVLSAAATISTFNAGVMGGSKLVYVLAREKKLPPFCARLSSRGAPIGAVLVLGALAAASALVVMRWNLQLEAAILGSALVCLVYAAMLLAARKIFGGGTMNAVLAFVMTLIGIASVLSDAKYVAKTLVGASAALLLATLLAFSSRPKAKADLLGARRG